ncbi:MAG: MBL fold metallo-hydrolase [Christensenellales bacterium]|jgi:L-ascorbate metabolism protein UlaG (beta-lactamase superfamily)
MKLTWLGHACFEIAATQAVVITDPYDASVGYPIAARKADIVTVSHEHYDHNDTLWVDAGAVCREPGQYERGGVQIHGIPSYHDRFRGQKRGGNVIFKLILDGLRVCHLGDLGHRIDEALTRTIGLVDVLLIPIGGVYTIDAEDALDICRKIEPRLVVAMHFSTPATRIQIADERQFLHLSGGEKLSDCSITFDRRSLTGPTRFVALDYYRP